jgi:hypothetical protein
MKYIILAAAVLLAACGGNSAPTTTNTDVSVTGASGDSSTPVADNSDTVDDNNTNENDSNESNSQNSNQTDSDSSGEPNDSPPSAIDTFEHLATDALWMACEPDAGLGDRDAWQQIQVQFNEFRDCVKVCPTDDSFIPDPDFPGLGWNNRLRTACAVATDATAGAFIPVPVYLPTTGRQSFTSAWSYPLFAGTGQWQCTHQQRQLSSDSFSDTGTTVNYRFYGNGLADVNNAAGTALTAARWWFDGYAGTRRIALPTASGDDNLIPSQYIGNVQLDNNTLAVYRTTVDRLLCTAVAPAAAIPSVPLSPASLDGIEPLALQQLIGNPLQCRSFETLSLSIDGQSFTNVGYSSNYDTEQAVLINVREVAETDADGDTRYALDSSDNASYTFSSRQFDSSFRIAGEVSRSFSQNLIDFKPVNNRIIMTNTYRQGGSGSSSESVTYSICE